VAGYWECGNEPSGSIKFGEFITLAGDLLASQERLWPMEFVGWLCK